jgi:hypothetical protein
MKSDTTVQFVVETVMGGKSLSFTQPFEINFVEYRAMFVIRNALFILLKGSNFFQRSFLSFSK